MDQYAGSPGRSNYCYAELTASFVNFLHCCLPSSGFYCAAFMVQGKITEADALTVCLDAIGTPPRPDYRCPHLRHPHIFMPNALFCHNPSSLSWLGTGSELFWLAYPVAWLYTYKLHTYVYVVGYSAVC